MRRLLLLFLFALPAFPQASNIPNTISIQASGAPSGACGNNFVYTNSATNDFYNCVAGAWNKVSSAGGAGTVTSIATTGPIGGGTITATGTITCTTCTTATTPTNHGVMLGAGSQALGVTAAGTTGQVLTGVTGADPTFQAVALPTGVGGPGSVLLEEHTASTSAELDFTTCISGTYSEYQLVIDNLVPATNGDILALQMSTNGGSSYDATGKYWWATVNFSSAGVGNPAVAGATDTFLQMNTNVGNGASTGVSGGTYLYNPGGAGFKYVDGHTVSTTSSGQRLGWENAGSYESTTAVNAFRVVFGTNGTTTHNITSGTVRCYGLTK